MKIVMPCYKNQIFLLLVFSAAGYAIQFARMKEGESDVFDVDNPNFDLLRELRKENTMKKMRANIAKKCESAKPADIMLKSRKSGIQDSYLVTLCNSDRENTFRKMFEADVVTELRPNKRGMKVIKVHCDFKQLRRLAKHPLVADIEQDEVIEPFANCKKQKFNDNSFWSLDRIGQKNNSTLDGVYRYNTTFQEEVDVYVVDTGVQANAAEYGDRLKEGYICNDSDCYKLENYPGGSQDSRSDLNGHGTHVTGSIGSNTYGVAKNVNIYPIKLMDYQNNEQQGYFTLGTITNALSRASDSVTQKNKTKLSVVNVSLGGPFSSVINREITAMYDAGITVVVAAGNSATDSCASSPGSADGAITVAATDKNDAWCSFSNKGACVDILAPGADILSLDNAGISTLMTGTSMAAPHVTGGVAVLMAQYFQEGGLTPDEVKTKILKLAQKGKVSGVPTDTTDEFVRVTCYR